MKKKIKNSRSDKIFNIINIVLLVILMVVFIYPFYYCIVLSFNDGNDALKSGIYFWPRMFTLDNYKKILETKDFLTSAVVTVARTLIGTVSSVIFTAMFGFAMSKSELVFRKFYMVLATITMYFGGGLIPTYIFLKQIHLYDSFWVYILPSMFSVFNAIVFMSFFRSIPAALDESAKIDGANYITIFTRIILPLAKPVIAAISIFVAVGQWNSWFDTMLYTSDSKLTTLSYFFIKTVKSQEFLDNAGAMLGGAAGSALSAQRGATSTSLQLASMVIASFPIIVIYPFLQKYFVKGVMVGSVKG